MRLLLAALLLLPAAAARLGGSRRLVGEDNMLERAAAAAAVATASADPLAAMPMTAERVQALEQMVAVLSSKLTETDATVRALGRTVAAAHPGGGASGPPIAAVPPPTPRPVPAPGVAATQARLKSLMASTNSAPLAEPATVQTATDVHHLKAVMATTNE